MSEPLVTRSENRAGVVISRRLEDERGQFAGVVTAIVDLEDLEGFYGAVNLGQASAIHLLRDDGTLLVRNPSPCSKQKWNRGDGLNDGPAA